MDFTGPRARPFHIGTFHHYAKVDGLRAIAACAASSLTWVANLAVYVPFSIPFAYPVKRLWWYNGTTITTSNVDVGVFSLDGEKIASTGTIAQSGASAIQYANPLAEVWLPPGAYFFGLVNSSTTARVQGTSSLTAANLRVAGVMQEALAATVLPSRMTPAALANALFPYCGITRTTTGF